MSIDVHVRLRPGIEHSVWATAETVVHNTLNSKSRYFFSKVHPTSASNTTLFRGVEGLIHAAYEGKHVTIMAYGQTGSGKTHSMLGTDDDAGIVPRAAKLLLDKCKSAAAAASSSLVPTPKVLLSITEIYNDTVRDLMDSAYRELNVKDGSAPEYIAITDAKKQPVHSLDEFLSLCQAAFSNRKTGVTNMNEHSSRSHMIITLEIQRGQRVSSISLVDLAGSESASRANTKGLQLQEGGHINQSLLSLGNCVNAIVANRPHIPYRESKLTRLLRHCLGGNGLTCILCCVNPGRDNQDTTNASLQFAQRAMKIKSDPVVTIPMGPLMVHQYVASMEMSLSGRVVTKLFKTTYQRGLADAYHHSVGTVGSILTHARNQVGLSMHAFSNVQRMLLANTQITYAERLRELESQITRVRDASEAASCTRNADSKRAREHDVAAQERRSKVYSLEQAISTKQKMVEAVENRWKHFSETGVEVRAIEQSTLFAEERANRAEISKEYRLIRVQIVCQFGEKRRECRGALLEAVTAKLAAPNTTSSSQREGDAEDDTVWQPMATPEHSNSTRSTGAAHLYRQRGGRHFQLLRATGLDSAPLMSDTALASHIERLNSELEDLMSAYEMLKEDLSLPEISEDGDVNVQHKFVGGALSSNATANDEESESLDFSILRSMSKEDICQHLRDVETLEAAEKQKILESTKATTTRRIQEAVSSASASVGATSRSQPASPVPARRVNGGAAAPPPSTATPQAQRVPAAQGRVSSAASAYVSPYSQRVMRSPLSVSAACSPKHCVGVPPSVRNCWSPVPTSSGSVLYSAAIRPVGGTAEEEIAAGMRTAKTLLREEQAKYLVSSPALMAGGIQSTDSGSMERLADDEESQSSQPLSQKAGKITDSGRPLLPRPRNFHSTLPSEHPPGHTLKPLQSIRDTSPGVKSGAENSSIASKRPAVQYHLSFSPQLDLQLNRGNNTTPKQQRRD